MIATLGYCLRDEEITLELARWVKDLGGCPAHDLFLIHDRRCNKNLVQTILDTFIASFKAVYPGEAPAEIDGWPQGANYFMRLISGALQQKPYNDFLWLEPDAIPLVPGWMDAIEKEYRSCGKPFMGDRVDVDKVDLHMSGIGVYHNPLYAFAGEAYRASDEAWDMAARYQILPKAHFTKLIEHAWKHPPFTMMSELETQIRKEAVLFHASKDGSLIRLLKQKLFPAVPVLAEPLTDEREGLPQPFMPVAKRSLPVCGEAKGESLKREGTTLPDLDITQSDSRGSRETSVGGGGERQTEVEVRANASSSRFPQRHDPSQPASCDIFIRTYPGDYPWLKYCLRAINKFASGFRKIWIISPQEMPMMVSLGYEWKQMNDETEDGYLAQQITKLYADVITDYAADYILHIDSDVILTQSITLATFLDSEGKVIWPYTPYKSIETPWQPITEKFMNADVDYEFMRRFPIMVPRWLYPRLREFCHQAHGVPISNYIKMQPHRAFSEFNALGAYAYAKHWDKFIWLSTETCELDEPFARQFHSYSGITPEVKAEIETILSGSIAEPARRMTESQVAPGEPESLSGQKPGSGSSTPPAQTSFDGTESKPVTHSHPQVTASHTPSVPSPIKVLPNDLWVLGGDQISQWVEQEGRLDHDQNLLPKILEHIKPGDVVLDVGAFIGDHTLAYARAVGETGVVYAFEPNPAAFQCLEHNTQMHNVQGYNYGLGDKPGVVPLSGNNGNSGGVYVGEHMKIADAMIWPLDLLVGRETLAIPWKPDLIKIDVEGYELKVLRGAEKTIAAYHPKLVIEINEEALRRQDTNVSGIFQWLENHGYGFSIMQENCDAFSPLYDILALPLEVANDKEVRAEVAGEEPGSPSEAPPKDGIHFLHADEPPTEIEQRLAMSLSLVDHVKELETYARQGVDQMKYVRKLLKKRGIMPMVRRKR